jgi:hypothetical protein
MDKKLASTSPHMHEAKHEAISYNTFVINLTNINCASIPKVVGSIPTVARHLFQACPVWIYTLRVTSQASYSPELYFEVFAIYFIIILLLGFYLKTRRRF